MLEANIRPIAGNLSQKFGIGPVKAFPSKCLKEVKYNCMYYILEENVWYADRNLVSLVISVGNGPCRGEDEGLICLGEDERN